MLSFFFKFLQTVYMKNLESRRRQLHILYWAVCLFVCLFVHAEM